MSETAEIIVYFVAGTSEEAAKKVIAECGGTVRRRMRADTPEQVILLTKIPSDGRAAFQSVLDGHGAVRATEDNAGGFGIR